MSLDDDEGAFASVFMSARRSAKDKTQRQKKAERYASMTDAQHSRLGRERPVQINFRTTAEKKTLAAGLAKFLNVPAALMFEEALETLAKAKGYKGAK